MTDLSHWDFAEHFSGYDAAALILGIEPSESETEQWRVRVVTDRMEIHYKQALKRLFHMDMGDLLEVVHGKDVDLDSELQSVKMEELEYRATTFNEETPLSDWLTDRRKPSFENQSFKRSAIARWLKAIGMKSAYSFERNPNEIESKRTGRWPWGNHHTEMLGHLEAAALRFWVNYEPQEPSTANTNATVSDWLFRERKVSRTMADAIASMLRADGLPPGPRK